MEKRKYPAILMFIVFLVGVQVATKLSDTAFFLTQLTMSAYYSLILIGLCLLIGYAGQISLGHAGFFAIGGYTSAFLTTHDLTPIKNTAFVSLLSRMKLLVSRQDLYGGEIIHFHPFAAFAVAVLLTIAVAYLIGGPVLKLKGHYLAMATLGFGIIVNKIVIGTTALGAADGLSEVPAFTLSHNFGISGDAGLRVGNYYFAWGLVVAGMVLLVNLVNSRVGRALRSIHSAEDAAGAMGIDTARYKLSIFVLSAVFAAISGAFLTHYNGGIGPSEASIMKSVRYVAVVAIGGMANLWGTLTMGLVLNFLSLRGYFGSYDDAVFGGILIIIMLFAPEGLLHKDLFSSLKRLLSRAPKEEGQA